MRARTYLGLLGALLLVVLVSYLTHQNRELLYEPFQLGAGVTAPLYVALLIIFLLGFLPTATILFVQTLKRDLARRRERKVLREARSLHEVYRRGVDFVEDGQWGKAVVELEAVLAEKPEDFSTLLLYGQALRQIGRAEEGLEVHRRASVLYPRSVALLYQLARDYEAQGERQVAREIRSRIVREFPGLGLAVLRRRRTAALAAEDWDLASSFQERIEALLDENDDAAGRDAERQRSLGLRYERGVALLDQERVEEAREIFVDLLQHEPAFIPARIMLGEAELLRDEEETAIGEWRAGYEQTGSPVFLQRIEDHFIEREDPARAIEVLRQLIAVAAHDLLPRFYLGRLYYRLEMHEEAYRVLAEVGERLASSPTYHLLLARIHERRGEVARAVEAYGACVRQAGLRSVDYLCRVCRERYEDWRDRCPACGSWNSVDVDLEEERIPAAELGVRETPVWSGYEGLAEEVAGELPEESPKKKKRGR